MIFTRILTILDRKTMMKLIEILTNDEERKLYIYFFNHIFQDDLEEIVSFFGIQTNI